jgi:hypothetical protein
MKAFLPLALATGFGVANGMRTQFMKNVLFSRCNRAMGLGTGL